MSVWRVCCEGSKAGLRLLFCLCRVCGESLLSAEGLHVDVDLQLSRTTCQCLQASSITYVFLTALRGFLGMTKAPSKMSHLVFATALLCSIDGSFIHHCLYFFLQISAVVGQRLKSQSSHPTNSVEIPRSSETDEIHVILSVLVCTCCSQKRNRRPFSKRVLKTKGEREKKV